MTQAMHITNKFVVLKDRNLTAVVGFFSNLFHKICLTRQIPNINVRMPVKLSRSEELSGSVAQEAEVTL
jgi:hypothetical protein